MQVVNEEGQTLIDRATNKSQKEVNGLTKEWFQEQSLKPPKELEDEEIERDEEGRILLDDKHLDYESLSVGIPLKNINSWVEHSDMGCIVNTKCGNSYHVYEEFDEIDDYIDFLNLTWFGRFKISVSSFFARFKNKKVQTHITN